MPPNPEAPLSHGAPAVRACGHRMPGCVLQDAQHIKAAILNLEREDNGEEEEEL